MKTVLMLLLFIHVSACGWFMVVSNSGQQTQEKKWIQGQYKLFGETGEEFYT